MPQLVFENWRHKALGWLPERLLELLRNLRMRADRRQALDAIASAIPAQKGAHGARGELVISLTSYPARFDTLPLTLKSLLRQTVRQDRLVLWLTEADAASVSSDIAAFAADGLEIHQCDDLRSFKKLIPAIEAFPEAYIVTADDDLYFPPNWLETLTADVPEDHSIRAWRTHRLMRDADGVAPYLQWEFDVQDEEARMSSADLLPTSGSGVLYPPHCLHPQVTDRSAFQRLCPNGDDLWFYWCARMAGTPIRKVGGRMKLITWPGSQDQSLWADNRQGGNDRMIHALIEEFGLESLGLDDAS